MQTRVSPLGLGMAVWLTIAGEKVGEQGLLRYKTVGVPDGIPEGGVAFVRLGWFYFRFGER